jgi:hypothetical protein
MLTELHLILKLAVRGSASALSHKLLWLIKEEAFNV